MKQTVLDGENFKIPTVKRKGYKFLGWYNGKTKIKESKRAYSNLNIVAKWEKIRLKKPQVTVPKQKRKRYARIKIRTKGTYEGFQIKIGKKNCKKKGESKEKQNDCFGKI